MGLYIKKDSNGNEIPFMGAIPCLLQDGAMVISEKEPPSIIPENLVCVINNFNKFESVLYVDSLGRLQENTYSFDDRPKTWLIYPHAKKLAEI